MSPRVRLDCRLCMAMALIARGCVRLRQPTAGLGCNGVICGLFHQPALRERDGLISGNCGEWRENFTALAACHNGTLMLIGGRLAMATEQHAWRPVQEVYA